MMRIAPDKSWYQPAVLLVLLAVFLIPQFTVVADVSPDTKDEPKLAATVKPFGGEVADDNKLTRRIDFTLDGLMYAVDLWYDASIKDNPKLVARYDVLLDNTLHQDLEATEGAILHLIEDIESDSPAAVKVQKHQELAGVRATLETKQALARSIGQSEGFSEKYRLLGDYINVLRKELGMPKLKFADVLLPQGR